MKKNLLFVLLAAVCLAATLSIYAATEVSEADRLKIITRLTANLIGRQHYRQQPLDASVSSQIFDEYFKVLDPNKMFFTAEDVREFEPQRMLLARKLNDGDASFAFAVYERFLKRFEEYRAFTEEMLKKPFDFTVDETFEPDRRKLPRPANDEELHQLWAKKLKSDLLYFRLIRRSLEEDNASEKNKQNSKADETKAIRALWERQSPEEKVAKRLRDLHNIYQQREKIDILGFYLAAVAQVYGPHSGYQPPKMDEDFEINMSLSLSGIGATLMSDDGYVRVVSIVPGGPAALDGRLHPEDRIIAVAQENGEPVDVIDMSVDNAVKLIRGPAGSKVTLTVLPGKKGRNAVPENITLTRAKVELKDSEAQGEIREITRPDGSKVKIGIIDLPSFYMDFAGAAGGDPNYKSCSRDVKKLLEDFKKEHVEAVVMDLRGNGGGSLPEAIALTGLFIPTGPVVQVRLSDRSIQVESDKDESVTWDGPLVVLTNKFSASAAEIFAGAIKDYQRGLLVGDTRTFGKGTVLTMMQLDRMLELVNRRFPAGSVRLETAMFFRINGGSVQQLGVAPDIVLPSLTEEMEIGEMFSDNHLPWDSIRPRAYRVWDAELPMRVDQLKKNSEARITASPDYQKLLSRIQRFKTQLGRKEISLNEEKRWKEYLEEKNAQDADPAEELDEPLDTGSRRRGPADDPILQEAATIAADYADSRKKK